MSNATQLREDTHGVIPYTGSDLSLYDIEDGLRDAVEQYELATESLRIAEGESSDSDFLEGLRCAASIAEVVLKEYLAAEVRKVNGVTGYLRYTQAKADAAKVESERIYAMRKSWQSRHDALEAIVLGVMQQFEQKKFETATSFIRRQNNGGVVSPDIYDPKAVPDKFVRVTVQMSAETFKRLPADIVQHVTEKGTRDFDMEGIRKALDQPWPCTNCDGAGWIAGPPFGEPVNEMCVCCQGTGQGKLPGARHGKRGEGLRIG